MNKQKSVLEKERKLVTGETNETARLCDFSRRLVVSFVSSVAILRRS